MMYTTLFVINILFQNNADSFDFNVRRKDLIQGVIGSGIHRKIILNPNLWKDSKYRFVHRVQMFSKLDIY